MKKKLTLESTGLHDCALEKALKLKADGFKAVYKFRCRSTEGEITSRDERLNLYDLDADLEQGEAWGLVYYDGEKHRKVYFPPLLTLEGKISITTEKAKKRHWMSQNSEGWIQRQLSFFEAAGQQVKVTFETKAGKTLSKITNRKFLKKSSEWKNRRKKKTHLERIEGALDAERAADRMKGALEELTEAGETITPAIWKALEGAFQAGESAGRYESTKARLEAAQGRPMTETTNRKGPRREWTSKALKFMQSHTKRDKVPAREVAQHLKENLVVAFEEWGDDILFFEDDTTKSKGRFEAALTHIRKKV